MLIAVPVAVSGLTVASQTFAAVYAPQPADVANFTTAASDTATSVLSTMSTYAVVLIPLVVLGFVIRFVAARFFQR